MKCWTLRLNDVALWIGNYPYAYGTRWRSRSDESPSRRTIFRLRDAIERADETARELPARDRDEKTAEEWPEYISGSWR